MITVVVPVYKVGRYIENSMKSLIAQTFKDYEILLVDNNSPDDSIQVAEGVLKNADVNYRVVKQSIQGLPAAREKGFDEAKGEWVVTIDPDDTISPTYLEELYHYAKSTGVELVFCRFKETPEKELFVFCKTEEGSFSVVDRDVLMDKLLRRELSLMITNTIIKKSLYEKIEEGFDKEVVLGADLIFVWRLLLNIDKVGYLQSRLYNHFTREDSLMTAPSAKKIDSNLAGYKRLCEIMSTEYSEQFSKWVYAREVFALLSVVSIYGEYPLFIENRKRYYDSDVRKALVSFPDRRIVMMNSLLSVFPWVFYKVTKKLKQPNSWLNKTLHKH